MEEPRQVFFVMDSQRDENGELIPCIAIENETGYWKTVMRWGTDINAAEEMAGDLNKARGISENDAHGIILSTMRKGAVEKPRL